MKFVASNIYYNKGFYFAIPFYKIAFIAKYISNKAPIISMKDDENFLNKFANQNPEKENTNVTIPIKTDGLNTETSNNLKDTPAPNASILVAIAKKKRQYKEIQQHSIFSLVSNALFKNFKPKNINIVKTIHFEAKESCS